MGRSLSVTVGTLLGSLSRMVTESVTCADAVTATLSSYDWSDTNLPWAYPAEMTATEREALFAADWDPSVPIVDLGGTAGQPFLTRLNATCNAQSVPVVVRLPEGVHHLTSFPLSGSSGYVDFAHAIYNPKCRGLLGQGADRTIIQLDANSMSTAQLDALALMDESGGLGTSNNRMRFAMFQPVGLVHVYIAGIRFRADDQQFLPSVAPGLAAKGITPNQPAPFGGVAIEQNVPATISYCAFIGASRACYAAPPFEHAAISSQYDGPIHIHHCEIDGRLDPAINPARPRRGGIIMGNNEQEHVVEYSWMHHCNISRYAINDQNRVTNGHYVVRRSKIEYIGNGNIDPALNGGNPLGGASGAVCLGNESTQALIEYEQVIGIVDNTVVNNSISQHVGFAEVAGIQRSGGRFYLRGGQWRNRAFPALDGYICIRIYAATRWWTDGIATTIFVYNDAGQRLQPWLVSGAWPPNPATGIGQDGQPVSPATHYLVRNS